MTHRAVILAAGRGERLVKGFAFPKPLKRVVRVPLIVRILRNLEDSGVRDVALVVGYLGDVLAAGIAKHQFNLNLHFIENEEFDKPNGTSLLKARDFVTGPTYVMMSDHLWSPGVLAAVRDFPLAVDEAVLGVDRQIDRCFDLPDATKVSVRGDRVDAIGKQLVSYNALDTGVFCVTPALFEALAELDGPEGCSLSQGVARLAQSGKMRVADVGNSLWVDVDTPEAHAFAEELVLLYGDSLSPYEQPTTQVVASL